MDRDVRLYRIGCGAALVAGPALFFVDNLIHPEELGRGNEPAHAVQQSAWSAPYYALTVLWAAALVALLGSAWAGFAILRLDDASFAAGRA